MYTYICIYIYIYSHLFRPFPLLCLICLPSPGEDFKDQIDAGAMAANGQLKALLLLWLLLLLCLLLLFVVVL